MAAWTAIDVAPVSPLVITALIVADGASLIRVMRLWTSASSTSAIADSGTLTAEPTGSARSASTESRASASIRKTRLTGSASPTWMRPTVVGVSTAPDLGADLGRGEAHADRPVRIDPDLDLRRGLDEVARDVRETRTSARAASTACAVSATTSASSALTITLRPFVDAPPCMPTVTS